METARAGDAELNYPNVKCAQVVVVCAAQKYLVKDVGPNQKFIKYQERFIRFHVGVLEFYQDIAVSLINSGDGIRA